MLVGSPLDHETQGSYTVKVIATDPSESKDTIDVTITVNNLEEPGTVSLSWRWPQVGTEIIATEPTDPDGGVSGVGWTWERSDPHTSSTGWSPISGETSSSYTPVAADEHRFLRATASYTDELGPGKTAQAESDKKTRTAPEDNSPPAFPEPDSVYFSGGYQCLGDAPDRGVCLHVKRSSPVGAAIYQPARAEDPDGDDVRYSLEGADTASFEIVASTGYLLTKQLFMEVDNTPFTVTIRATDPSGASGASGASDTIKATITPSGGRESPVVKGPDEIRYPENGTWRVATYTAKNNRGPTTGWIISVEPGGGDGDYFDINHDGVLTFNDPPDYEDPKDEGGNNEYSFSITAYDTNPPNGERSGQTFFNVTVIVTNLEDPDPLGTTGPGTENNDPPAFPDDSGTRSVPENTGPGEKIGTPLRPTTRENDDLQYSLAGKDARSFDIDSSTGQLMTKDPLDHEERDSYEVEVSVTEDNGNSGQKDTRGLKSPRGVPRLRDVSPQVADTTTITIMVDDENEPPEVSGRTSVSYPENGTADVATYTASDPEDKTITWLPLSGADAAKFSIEDGVLKFQAPPDHEEPGDIDDDNVYLVTVKASDGTKSQALEVTVTVTDVNEPPESDGTINDEDTPSGSSNSGGGSSNSGGNTPVQTQSNTPVTRAAPEPPRETTPVAEEVDDGVDDGSAGAGEANQAPVFTAGDRTERTVAEQAARGTKIGVPVTATDADGDPLTYTRGGVDAAFFAIDNTSGQLAANAELDFEVRAAYTFVMGVSDGRGGADFTVVTIQVTDIDEVPIDNPATQAAGTVYPDSQTTVETPDGVASITFPAGSRDAPYHVRVDSDPNNCAGGFRRTSAPGLPDRGHLRQPRQPRAGRGP